METTIIGNLQELLVDIVLRLPNGNLPRDLLVDILLRLPVKVLSRFKCVCKEWCFLIESASFVKQHFEQERNRERLLVLLTENKEPNQNDQEVDNRYIQQMMIEQQEFNREFKPFLFVDETLSEYEVPYQLHMPDEVALLIGPLNGVFCVATKSPLGPMALLNPTLRQFKPLPLVDFVYPQKSGFIDSKVGLGLDPLTGDYKLVMLFYFKDMSIDDDMSSDDDMSIDDEHCAVYICTSESDSWRLLEDVDPIISRARVFRSLQCTYLNGDYYWLLENFDSSNVALLAFNMMTEKFRKIQGPISRRKNDFLALCGDSLDLLVYDQYEKCIDVWKMVNEGCWIRRSRVGPLDSIRWPLCLWKNDELLFDTTNGFLTLCNISTQESKIIEAPQSVEGTCLGWVFVYKESLVSIKGEAGKCKLWDTSSDFIKNFFKDASSERYEVIDEYDLRLKRKV